MLQYSFTFRYLDISAPGVVDGVGGGEVGGDAARALVIYTSPRPEEEQGHGARGQERSGEVRGGQGRSGEVRGGQARSGSLLVHPPAPGYCVV